MQQSEWKSSINIGYKVLTPDVARYVSDLLYTLITKHQKVEK